ncbi:hypothetical protein BXU10_07325 [Flavobacterium sp. LM4]|nr:hypothetical protein BXU10_07325 [Flavobacterium sp. LM4]
MLRFLRVTNQLYSIPMLCFCGNNIALNPNAPFFKGYKSAVLNPYALFFVGTILALNPNALFFKGYKSATLNPYALIFYGSQLALYTPKLCFFKGSHISCITPCVYYNFLIKNICFLLLQIFNYILNITIPTFSDF